MRRWRDSVCLQAQGVVLPQQGRGVKREKKTHGPQHGCKWAGLDLTVEAIRHENCQMSYWRLSVVIEGQRSECFFLGGGCGCCGANAGPCACKTIFLKKCLFSRTLRSISRTLRSISRVLRSISRALDSISRALRLFSLTLRSIPRVKRTLACVKRSPACAKWILACVKRTLPCTKWCLACTKWCLACAKRSLACGKPLPTPE